MSVTHQVLERLTDLGVQLRLNGDRLTAYPKEAVTEEAADLIRSYKADLVALVRSRQPFEERREKVLAMLRAVSGTRLAYLVEDDSTDPVVCSVAIRQAGMVFTCDVEIPKAKYDGFKLLELADKWGKGSTKPTVSRELAVLDGGKVAA
jgi:hypothetical protein